MRTLTQKPIPVQSLPDGLYAAHTALTGLEVFNMDMVPLHSGSITRRKMPAVLVEFYQRNAIISAQTVPLSTLGSVFILLLLLQFT